MTKIEKLLKSLRAVIEKEDEEDLSEFPAPEYLKEQISAYESTLAKLLRKQKRYFTKGVEGYAQKSDGVDPDKLNEHVQSLFDNDTLGTAVTAETAAMMKEVIPYLTAEIMDNIDKDVSFSVMTKRTSDWIDSTAEELGSIMKLTSHDAVAAALKEGLKNGEGIPKIVERLKDLPEFDRKRAENTARTEVLAASSASTQEAFSQSVAVEGKTWKHSGAAKNKPRDWHLAYSGTEKGVEEAFELMGETGMFPRDMSFSARNRVRCKCVMLPVVSEKVLKLSKEEKEKIREERIAALGGYAE